MTTIKLGSICFLLLLISGSFACTVISASIDSLILTGGNKDWNNLNTRIKIIPPKEADNGIIYFGYQINQGFQNVCGINDKGLWYEGASLPERFDVYNMHNKPEIQGELCEKALAECSNVCEVVELYSTYFTRHWNGHIMWVDSNGNSVIIEYGENDIVFIDKRQNYQILTNFYLLNNDYPQWNNCYRYNVAESMLSNVECISVDLFKNILKNTHQIGTNPTLFSTICDLSNLKVYVYNFHNFKEYVILDLAEEMLKGENYYSLPELFCQLQLCYPEKNSTISSNDVIFSWKGNNDNYILQYSPDKDFINYKSVTVNKSNSELPDIDKFSFFSSLLLLAGFSVKFKPKLVFLIVFVLASILSNCSYEVINSPYPESDQEFSTAVSDLQNNSIYYWKVVSTCDDRVINESEVFNFYCQY